MTDEGIPTNDLVLEGDLVIIDAAGVVRLRLDRETGSIFGHNSDGEVVLRWQVPGNNLSFGGHGQDGDLTIFDADANTVAGTAQAVLHINSQTGTLRIGGSGVDGRILGQDGENTQTFLIDAGAGSITVGNDGQEGTIQARNSSGQTTIRMDAENGNIRAGGGGVDGDLLLRGPDGALRVHLSADGQRMEIRDPDGEITAMMGGDANIRAGSNGRTGNLFLFPSDAGNIFSDGQASIALNGETGNASLGGSAGDGDLLLRDTGGATRVHLSASDQRLEIRDADGAITSMMGGDANIRVGTNGRSGNVYLYPRGADDIFDNTQATIELNADAGDIVLSNGDCAEEFRLATDAAVEAGQVVRLTKDGGVRATTRAYDSRVAGVVAGAGGLRPGIVLGRAQAGETSARVALMGQVYCWADAEPGEIEIGDILVSGSRFGHAMRASDPAKAFGAMIGKAMEPLACGTGLIRVLVNIS
ncbi:hypothetical protein [uncultured Roseobacter sp.]|uniref:hypothetical protein n=1 Tax=uncultured Roseobacter sp. TaxID=114847 RepID=UPI002616C0EB|nr:hypothetical protein [uncultured Roseobacter sp.]